MNKTWLIIKREYITRVRNRTFIISTFLTPLLFAGMIVAIAYIGANNKSDDEKTEVIVKKSSKPRKPHSDVAEAVGYASGFLVYLTLLIYGSMVMRGVMEEKTNRVAEVVVSSVRPFQLMTGKIVGIGAVGLTQFFMWLILVLIFGVVIGYVVPPEILAKAGSSGHGMGGSSQDAQKALSNLSSGPMSGLASVNWLLVIPCFLFYFFFGYLFYAAIFAAVGSTVSEDPQEAQSLMFPITMPIILALVIMINSINNPDGAMATWCSMIPLFSPVVMMARIPFGVPWYQLVISMLLLGGGFLVTIWLGAKIYRTGILLYGKKVTWREIGKWVARG